MALFKKFRMTEEQLKRVPIQDGYFYLTSEGNSNKGKIYIDWDHVRYSINSKYARGLISADGETIIEIEDIYKLIQDTAANQNISSTKEYQLTIKVNDWVDNKYVWTNADLQCGPNGITPPQISCMENPIEYLYLITADATSRVGITFSVYKKPTQDIKILIIDTIGKGGQLPPSDGSPDDSTISLQSKTVNPSKSTQVITADPGYTGLSSVSVNAIDDIYQDVSNVTATAADVLEGKTIVTSNGNITGNIPNNGIIEEEIDGLTDTRVDIPAGYTSGGYVALDDSIENALKEIT